MIGGGATSEHEEAESKILFFRRRVWLIYTVSFGAFSFGPRFEIFGFGFVEAAEERRRSGGGGGGGGGRIESVESHMVVIFD